MTFTFTKTFAKKRHVSINSTTKPILKTLQSELQIKPKPRNKANQNHCEPKRKPKTLKPILATRQNRPEIMPAEKVPPSENAENLKTCLLKKYWPKPLTWKIPPLKRFWISTPITKVNLANQIWFCICSSALPANGLRYPRWGGRRDAVRLEKGWGVEKGLESRQNPQRRVHALLAGFVQDALIETQNHRHKTDKIIARTLLFSKNQKLNLCFDRLNNRQNAC